MQRWNQILLWDGPFIEELFHQSVVPLGNHLHQLFVRFLSLIFQIGRNLRFFPLPIPAQFVRVCFHADQVHHPAQVLLPANR